MEVKNEIKKFFESEITEESIRKIQSIIDKSVNNRIKFSDQVIKSKYFLTSIFQKIGSIDLQLLLLELIFTSTKSSEMCKHQNSNKFFKCVNVLNSRNFEKRNKDVLIELNRNGSIYGSRIIEVNIEGFVEKSNENDNYYIFFNDYDIKIIVNKIYYVNYTSIHDLKFVENKLELILDSRVIKILFSEPICEDRIRKKVEKKSKHLNDKKKNLFEYSDPDIKVINENYNLCDLNDTRHEFQKDCVLSDKKQGRTKSFRMKTINKIYRTPRKPHNIEKYALEDKALLDFKYLDSNEKNASINNIIIHGKENIEQNKKEYKKYLESSYHFSKDDKIAESNFNSNEKIEKKIKLNNELENVDDNIAYNNYNTKSFNYNYLKYCNKLNNNQTIKNQEISTSSYEIEKCNTQDTHRCIKNTNQDTKNSNIFNMFSSPKKHKKSLEVNENLKFTFKTKRKNILADSYSDDIVNDIFQPKNKKPITCKQFAYKNNSKHDRIDNNEKDLSENTDKKFGKNKSNNYENEHLISEILSKDKGFDFECKKIEESRNCLENTDSTPKCDSLKHNITTKSSNEFDFTSTDHSISCDFFQNIFKTKKITDTKKRRRNSKSTQISTEKNVKENFMAKTKSAEKQKNKYTQLVQKILKLKRKLFKKIRDRYLKKEKKRITNIVNIICKEKLIVENIKMNKLK